MLDYLNAADEIPDNAIVDVTVFTKEK